MILGVNKSNNMILKLRTKEYVMIALFLWLQENLAKEKEDEKVPMNLNQEDEDIPLFYSDLMPLLV